MAAIFKLYRELFLLSILILFSGCSEDNSLVLNSLDQKVEVSLIKQVSIPIDSVTSNYASFYESKEIDGKPYLIVQNYPEKSILFFDLIDNKLSFKILLKVEGPNGINNAQGIYVHNLDSVFLLDYSKSLNLINREGQIISKFDIGYDSGSKDFDNVVSLESGTPMYYEGGKMLYPNADWFYGRPVFEFVDLNSGIVTEFLPFPTQYKDDKIEGIWYDRIYSAQKGNETIVGFNLDSDFYVIRGGEAISVETGFGRLCAECHYFDYKGQPSELTRKQHGKIVKGFFTNFSFMNVMYDEKNNLIYRVLKGQLTDSDYENLPTPLRFQKSDYYVLVFDGDSYEYLGSDLISRGEHWISPDDYFLFTSGGYIYMARRDGTEDEFLFDVYKVNLN